MFDLAGKTAVITGGGSGIGRAIAEMFARQGAHVLILEVQTAKGQEAAEGIRNDGGKADSMECDISRDTQVQRVFQEIDTRFKKIDILVNNAGISHVGTVEQTKESDFDRLYNVNVKGVFLCAKAAVIRMCKQGKGVILNMASTASLIGLEDRFAYSMTKGAVLTMTMSLAIDYMKKGIRCNAIAPARIHTPFVDGYLAKNYPGKEDEMFQKLSQYQPIGRMGTPEEVAALALYLCSDEAAFVTGQVYPIDGGVLVS